MNLKTIYTIIYLLVFATVLSAQPYKNAVGVKAGYSSGFVFKHFFDYEYAIDVQALYNAKGFQLTGLYQYQFTPYSKKRMYYYAGAGVYGGNWNNELAFGGAVSLGNEFAFRAAPITLGIEWKPMLNLYKSFDYTLIDFALTFRVML